MTKHHVLNNSLVNRTAEPGLLHQVFWAGLGWSSVAGVKFTEGFWRSQRFER